jgi:hypothetical protein
LAKLAWASRPRPASTGSIPVDVTTTEPDRFGAIYLKTRFRIDHPEARKRTGYGEVHEVTLAMSVPPGAAQLSRCLRLREEGGDLKLEIAADCRDSSFAKSAQGGSRFAPGPGLRLGRRRAIGPAVGLRRAGPALAKQGGGQTFDASPLPDPDAEVVLQVAARCDEWSTRREPEPVCLGMRCGRRRPLTGKARCARLALESAAPGSARVGRGLPLPALPA